MNSTPKLPTICFHHFGFTAYEDILFQCIAKKNARVYNVTFKSRAAYGSDSANLESPTFNRIILPDEVHFSFLRESENFSQSFCRLLLQQKFEIVVLPLSSIVSVFYSVLAKLVGITVIWHITVHTLPATFVGHLRSLIIRLSRITSSNVVTLSNMHKKSLVRLGFPDDKIAIIPHGINTKLFTNRTNCEQLREKLGLTEGKIILYIGKLSEEKGLIFLIQAMKLVANDVHLLIVGDGPLRKSLQQNVHDLELGNQVKFIGTIPRYEVLSYFSICDIHVAPSIVTKDSAEPFGMVFLEAMASGKPSIAFDIPAPLQQIISDGETGYLVKEKSIGELAAKISYLLNNDERRLILGNNAKQKASSAYDIDAVAEKWLGIFNGMVKR